MIFITYINVTVIKHEIKNKTTKNIKIDYPLYFYSKYWYYSEMINYDTINKNRPLKLP